jgi:hypothetical protein
LRWAQRSSSADARPPLSRNSTSGRSRIVRAIGASRSSSLRQAAYQASRTRATEWRPSGSGEFSVSDTPGSIEWTPAEPAPRPFSTSPIAPSRPGRGGRDRRGRGHRADPEASPLLANIASAAHHPSDRAAAGASRLARARPRPDERRGADEFVALCGPSLDRLATELERVRGRFGNAAIFGGCGWASAGRFHHAQSQLHRFLNCIGATRAR